jgi:hypothetical protein
MNRRQKKSGEKKYPEIISVRLTRNEKREFDSLMTNLNTNKSEFIRGKIKRILRYITVKK